MAVRYGCAADSRQGSGRYPRKTLQHCGPNTQRDCIEWATFYTVTSTISIRRLSWSVDAKSGAHAGYMTYAVVLRECRPDADQNVAHLLSRAFSLKDSTCATILDSTPIILIDELDQRQAAAMLLALNGLQVAGATIEISKQVSSDLPKIEWPKQPQVFKQAIDIFCQAYEISAPCPSCGQSHPVIDYLDAALQPPADTDHYTPQDIEQPASSSKPFPPPTKASANHFTGQAMPEITPFSNPVLPAIDPNEGNPSGITAAVAVDSRMEEMFPDDDSIIPDSNDITSILDQLLPDEQRDSADHSSPEKAPGSGGYSVFLSKLSDEARRQEAIPLLAELAGIAEAEADKLSRKVIIPVLRGVSQDEAEAAKHRFAQIKVLARVKAG